MHSAARLWVKVKQEQELVGRRTDGGSKAKNREKERIYILYIYEHLLECLDSLYSAEVDVFVEKVKRAWACRLVCCFLSCMGSLRVWCPERPADDDTARSHFKCDLIFENNTNTGMRCPSGFGNLVMIF